MSEETDEFRVPRTSYLENPQPQEDQRWLRLTPEPTSPR
jgi:hypothetical protein